MNEELMEHRIKTHDIRLNNYGQRIDKLEQENATLKVEIKNLCDNLKALTSVLKWFICLIIGAFVSFFFYVVQSNILK